MEYNEEMGGRLEFIQVRLNWDINQSLKFQRLSNSHQESTLCLISTMNVYEVFVQYVGTLRMIQNDA